MDKKLEKKLEKLCKLIRYDILTSTTRAGSGHPTSSLSAVELMTTLFFAGFYKKYDRFILSKGHASPLLYSLYHAGGLIDYKELMTLRKFGSRLEGHPTPKFPYVDVATGSLGQGLSIGVGMALGLRLKLQPAPYNLQPKIWVLIGDSEMAEGQVFEAVEIAAHYKLNNLIGIVDVNRLGQNGETLAGWDIDYYEKKAEAFGWEVITVKDGHNLKEIYQAFQKVQAKNLAPSPSSSKPIMIIAKTIKGKGVSFLEDKNGWHGKALNKEELKLALQELGKVDKNSQKRINFYEIKKEVKMLFREKFSNKLFFEKTASTLVATREAYGDALAELGEKNPDIVVLDAEVANSTYQNKFAEKFPERFFQMYITEQNMISVALGLSKIGFIPFVSTFAAFLTRGFDQIRMAQYSIDSAKQFLSQRESHPRLRRGPIESEKIAFASSYGIKIVGSHAGVSIGEDGPSQMGLEDLAMFRSILNSFVFYPSDAVSTAKLTYLMNNLQGIVYMRITRGKTPVIYDENEKFEIGGFKIHQSPTTSHQPPATLIISAGITLHEALKAQKELINKNIETTIVDLYCIKPLSNKLTEFIKKFKNIIVVEDHYPFGGIGEAVSSLLTTNHQPLAANFVHLCVRKTPMSGTPEDLLKFEEIDKEAIVKAVLSCQKK